MTKGKKVSLFQRLCLKRCMNCWISHQPKVFKMPSKRIKPKKRRRGKEKQTVKDDEKMLELYYNNINGLISKQESLKQILAMKKPDIVALCETKLHRNSKFDIKGYKVLKSNLKAGKEGILIAAKEGTYDTMELVYEAESRNIATVEIEYPKDTVRIIVAHRPQETANIEEKEDFFNDLSAEVERCMASQCRTIIAGDLNARVEYQDGQLQKKHRH